MFYNENMINLAMFGHFVDLIRIQDLLTTVNKLKK